MLREDQLLRCKGNVCVGRLRVNYWLRAEVKAADHTCGRRNDLVNIHLQNDAKPFGLLVAIKKNVGDQSERGGGETKWWVFFFSPLCRNSLQDLVCLPPSAFDGSTFGEIIIRIVIETGCILKTDNNQQNRSFSFSLTLILCRLDGDGGGVWAGHISRCF